MLTLAGSARLDDSGSERDWESENHGVGCRAFSAHAALIDKNQTRSATIRNASADGIVTRDNAMSMRFAALT